MRVVLQVVKKAKVTVDDTIIGQINKGFVLLVGMQHDDTETIVRKVADKIMSLRICSDDEGKMNLALDSQQAAVLAISQFTLYANIKKGRRPSFIDSMEPTQASKLYDYFCDYIRSLGFQVETGSFGAEMQVALVNDGPVTIIVDSETL